VTVNLVRCGFPIGFCRSSRRFAQTKLTESPGVRAEVKLLEPSPSRAVKQLIGAARSVAVPSLMPV